jgi:hypothetical protein
MPHPMPDAAKATIQFWTSIVCIAGLIATTMVCVIIDELDDGKVDQLTMLLAGGLISVTSACGSWLYRSNETSAARTKEEQ